MFGSSVSRSERASIAEITFDERTIYSGTPAPNATDHLIFIVEHPSLKGGERRMFLYGPREFTESH